MNAIFRTLLTWLVLLAIPFQGYAAAVSLPCTAAGGGVAQAAVVQQQQMPMAAGMHHDHHAMLMAAAAKHSQAAHAGHDSAAHDTGVHAKCGSCPACWVGPAMMPPAPGPVALQQPVRASIPFDPGHVPAFHPSLPERPPRPSLA